VPCGHHPRCTIEHSTEVVAVAQFSFTRRQPHPHRQFQASLRGHCGIYRRFRRRERRADTVTGVLEQEPAVRVDCRAQHLIVCGQRHPHPVRVSLPPTGRPRHIGEQERHHP
jgi:hypothetical protein